MGERSLECFRCLRREFVEVEDKYEYGIPPDGWFSKSGWAKADARHKSVYICPDCVQYFESLFEQPQEDDHA